MTRRAISPPPGSVGVPRIASHRAPADMTPTVRPKRHTETNGVILQLRIVRNGLEASADRLRDALTKMNCNPLELTSVLAAIEHVIEEENGR